MNSLSFYNEYLTAGERENIRQYGQNIPEPPKQIKQVFQYRPGERDKILYILKNHLGHHNTSFFDNLSDEKMKMALYKFIFEGENPVLSKEPVEHENRFIMVKNGPAYFAPLFKTVHFKLFCYYKILHDPFDTTDFVNALGQNDKYLFGMINWNNNLEGLSDYYVPDGTWPSYYESCPTGVSIVNNFGAQLNKFNIGYKIFESIGDRRPYADELPMWEGYNYMDRIFYDPYTGETDQIDEEDLGDE